MKNSEKVSARRSSILALLIKQGRAEVDEIAMALSVTPQTIRKDLAALEKQSKVVRFHGGATLLAGIEYTTYEARKNIAVGQKESIAKYCAKLIPNNASLIINSGTTTAAVAGKLHQHTGLRIITDSVKISNDIRMFDGVELIVPGGRVRKSDGAIVGHSTVEFIQQFRPDIAVIGVAAIGQDGSLLDYDMSEVAVARTIVECARHVILVVDSTKKDRMAPIKIADISQINTVITDIDCPDFLRRLCRKFDVQLFEVD